MTPSDQQIAATEKTGAGPLSRLGLGVNEVLLVLMVVALSVQGPNLFAFGGMDFTLGHALVGVVGAASVARVLLARRRPILPSASINVLFVTFVVITLVDTPVHGFGATILKYAFQYLVLIVALNLMVLVGGEKSERLILAGAWIVLAIVLINALAHAGAFLEYYDHPWDGHPNYATVFSGGVNLEATWPAMLGVFCRNNRGGWTYLGLTYVFGALTQSRAGLMLAVGAIVYVLLVKDGGRPGLRRVAVVAILAAAAALYIVAGPRAASVHSATESVSVTEEETVSDAPQGIPGRRGIWMGSIEAFYDAPVLGYGAGNAMDAVRAVTGYPYHEDNVHNYPLQVLLDFGLVGLAVFAVVVVRFLVLGVRARFRSPFAAFVALYLVGGMIQFKGGELLVGFALAGLVAFGYDMLRERA